MLFFAGTKDSLCDLELLKGVLNKVQAPWDLEVIQGGDHSFKTPKAMELSQEEVYEQILKTTRSWLRTELD